MLPELCGVVLKRLREHINGEAQLVMGSRQVLRDVATDAWEQPVVEHEEGEHQLQAVSRLLWAGAVPMPADVRPALARATGLLREQMREQEAELFPFLELVVGLAWALQQARVASAFGRTERVAADEKPSVARPRGDVAGTITIRRGR